MKYGEKILSPLVESNKFNIILRAHPQSFISEVEMIEELQKKFPNSDHFVWDREVDNIYAMSQADIMISDFSGIIFDFYTLYQKPILTMHGNYEHRGRDASDLGGSVWDLDMIKEIGGVIHESDVSTIDVMISDILSKDGEIHETTFDLAMMDQYPRESGLRGMDYIEKKLKEVRLEADSVEVVEDSYSEEIDANLPFLSRFLKTVTSPSMLFQVLMGMSMLTALIYAGSVFLLGGGLNQVTFSLSLPYSVLATCFVFVLFVISVWIKGKGQMKLSKNSESFKAQNILLIALPLTPIIQYIISNQEILNLSSSLKVFVYFASISLLMIVLIPWLLSSVIHTSLTTAVSLSFLFIVFNRASFGRTTRTMYILLLLTILCVAIFILLEYEKSKVVVIIFVVFFAVNTVTTYMNRELEEGNEETPVIELSSKFVKKTKDLNIVRKPDIFLMTYDAYAMKKRG